MNPDIAQFSKVELHCHYDGIVDAAMLRALGADAESFPVSAEELDAVQPVAGYDDFMRWFAVADPGSLGLDAFLPILRAHVDRLRAQNVCYAEIYTSMPRGDDDPVAPMRAVVDGVREREHGQTQVEFLAQISRSGSPEQVAAKVERGITLHEAGLIAGIAIAGPEEGWPMKPHRQAMRLAYDHAMPIEIHAGEWCGPESVWDALEYGFPARIGHGVSALQDEALVRLLRAQQTHIEMCPTSNVKTGAVDRIANHPIRRAFDLGLNVGVNTDDPGAFACSMNSEYQLLVDELAFTADELDVLRRNALAARFTPVLRVPVDGGG